MMKLHWSPRSPFVRKVMITLHETDQLDQVELVRSVAALHLPPNPDILADNPLAKIPTLVTQGGQPLYDSRVICEYLDGLAGGKLFPADPEVRMTHLRWQALADGLTDILLIWRTELNRPTGPWTAVTDGWLAKTRAAMAVLEAEAETLATTPFGIGQIGVVCALGQLDFRWGDCNWRGHFPGLAKAEAAWARRASVAKTAIVDDQDSGGSDVTEGCLDFGA